MNAGTLGLAIGLLCALPTIRTEAAERPNLVVILADDLGYGDVRCYNPVRGRIATPRLDRLAAEGMRFTDGHSSSGVCSPSRYTLLTGRYHWRTGQSGIVPLYGKPMIEPDRLTVGRLLQEKGYRTAAIGKWHLGWDWPIREGRPDFSRAIENGPTTRGFDLYFGTDVPNWPPYCFIEQDHTVGIPSVPLPASLLEGKRHLASKAGPALPDWQLEAILPTLATRACAFIRDSAASRKPFFLYLPLTSPHTPISPSEEWKGRSGFTPYADFVGQTDAVVGEVLDTLQQSGAARNTLVWFTSDNGCAAYIGVPTMESKGHFPSGPFRGYKASAWEGGHRVPFILRWPGVIPADTVCTQLVHQADLLATIADVLGYTLPDQAGEDSVSLRPLFNRPSEPVRQEAISQAADGTFAFRSGTLKLIAPRKGGSAQLFDLAADPAERADLSARRTGEVARLRARLDESVERGRTTPVSSTQPTAGTGKVKPD